MVLVVGVVRVGVVGVVVGIWIALMLHFLCPNATKMHPNVTLLPSCYTMQQTSALMLQRKVTLGQLSVFMCALMQHCFLIANLLE